MAPIRCRLYMGETIIPDPGGSMTDFDPVLSDKLDAAWGVPADWHGQGGHWTSLQTVRAAIARRLDIAPAASSVEWFFRYAADHMPTPPRRGLVLACGPGDLEREILRHGWLQEIVAVDLSPMVLDHARAEAAAAGLTGVVYRRADMNHLDLADEAPFDVVLSVSAVHHCAALERLYARLTEIMVPDGLLFLDEYVGPDRFQWPDAIARQANLWLDLLPDRLVRTGSGLLRRNFRAPTVDDVIAIDPSEAVRSSDVLPLLSGWFDVLEQRGYCGTLLHLVLADIAWNFATDDAAEHTLKVLIAAEERLQRQHKLADYFAVAIARPRKVANHSGSAPGSLAHSDSIRTGSC